MHLYDFKDVIFLGAKGERGKIDYDGYETAVEVLGTVLVSST